MTGDTRQPAANCPHCGKDVDPLRTGAVSIVDGRIVHFCSAACRENLLRGGPEQERVGIPSPSRAEEGDHDATRAPPSTDAGKATEAPAPSAVSRVGSAGPVLRRLRPLLLEIGGLLLALGIILWAPAGLLAGQLSLGAAAVAVLATLVLGVVDQLHAGASRIIESAAVPLAGAALLTAGVLGESAPEAAAWVVGMLLIQRLGRMLETLGRARSGVLEAVLGAGALSGPREWRDNSVTADHIRRVTIVLDWARFPVAAALFVILWLLAGRALEQSMIAGAIALIALEPRVLRMITGDAHLGIALAADRRGVGIRDAHAVEQTAAARVVLFIPHRCLLEYAMKVVDWRTAPGADEGRALSALGAAEAGVPGRVADAVRDFLARRGVEAIPAEEREVRPMLGVVATSEAGRVACGSRSLMLAELVSTAEHEEWARSIEAGGRRVIFLAVDGRVTATFALEEPPLPDVPEAMRRLAALGIEPAMITSAEANPGLALGARLGIDDVRFETPEEQLDRPLGEYAAAGDEVLLVGHGPAFDEFFRSAVAAVACGGGGSGMAGIDLRDRGLDELVWVARTAREATRGIRLNAVAAGSAVMLSLVLASGWHFHASAAAAVTFIAVAGAFSTWNGLCPDLARVRRRVLDLWSRLRRLVGIARAPGR